MATGGGSKKSAGKGKMGEKENFAEKEEGSMSEIKKITCR